MKLKIKAMIEQIPYPIGRHIARVPFSYRLGKDYSEFTNLLSSNLVDEHYVVEKFARIFDHAKRELPFYKDFYMREGVFDLQVKTLQDIAKVPLVTKRLLRDNLDMFSGAMKLNTGGTSGAPFAFYVDKSAFAREWAHMHQIWSLKKYSYTDIKLTLRGKNLGGKGIVYNPVHNEFVINTYLDARHHLTELVDLVVSKEISFLHGYPSAIYNFLKEVEAAATSDQITQLKGEFKCCLLGSEFPVPYMIQYLQEHWGLEYISWYGHSEMCILAYDKCSNNNYIPYHSYGYAEVVGRQLIGTSYHNFDMPLIRYDTGDLVEPSFNDAGLLESFSVSEGRVGDFVEDRNGKQIPLTALVFGRHHEIFEKVDCIQVKQLTPGVVEFLLTTQGDISADDACKLLDMSAVDIDYSAKIIREPVLTASGKMPLKVV